MSVSCVHVLIVSIATGRERSTEQGVTRRYAQLVADGEEDDGALVDQATIKDREWDSWKEENPRGWGNKMGKRF